MFVEHKEAGEAQEQGLDRPRQLLLKAASYIEKHGWCQNFVGTPGGKACIEGAICIADGRHPDADLLGDRLEAAQIFGRAVGTDAFRWNDSFLRTKDEVVAKLRSVALGV